MDKVAISRLWLDRANRFNLFGAAYFSGMTLYGAYQSNPYLKLRALAEPDKRQPFIDFSLICMAGVGLIMFLFSDFINKACKVRRTARPRRRVSNQQSSDNARRTTDRRARRTVRIDPPHYVVTRANAMHFIVLSIVLIGCLLILSTQLLNSLEDQSSLENHVNMSMHKYQTFNQTNQFTLVIDAIQEASACCGSSGFTDYDGLEGTGLDPGQYPPSCCGHRQSSTKICTARDVIKSRQTTGCSVILLKDRAATVYQIMGSILSCWIAESAIALLGLKALYGDFV